MAIFISNFRKTLKFKVCFNMKVILIMGFTILNYVLLNSSAWSTVTLLQHNFYYKNCVESSKLTYSYLPKTRRYNYELVQ